MAIERRRHRIEGTVQGVGFRPFVYGLATDLALTGFVLNDSAGVLVEVEGAAGAVAEFGSRLATEVPPLAVVDHMEQAPLDPIGSAVFEIRISDAGGKVAAAITPDVATCSQCLAEIRDPAARRYGYPFTNCTNCGPRFTITKGIPYDRPNTTMSSFAMCEQCKAEYEDPSDRRFHAQPIACPDCGPRLRLIDREGTELAGDPIEAAATMIRDGHIVAIKGLGGYHLSCDATNESAVAELRARKGREEKPLAVMVPSFEWACRLGDTTPDETAALASRRRPIVLVRRRSGAQVAPSVAPGNRHLGIMLPYTPLHHLLLAAVGRPIVLTSGNLSDEPIAYRDDDARARLGGIVDAFLVHDRDIHLRCDDSVVRVFDGREYPLRRARGFAPEPVTREPSFVRPVLAAGPELKHTFCLGAGRRAIVSHHIGDLESYEAMTAFVEAVEHYTRIFEITPEVVAHDLHPEYLSTKWAQDLGGVELVGVQHHHAHIASCLADNNRTDAVIGLALDGTGYGDDGAIWGCELLICDLAGYRRAAHLSYVPMPGGAAAIREPWRMAAVYLHAAFGPAAAGLELDFVARTEERWGPVLAMAERSINCPPTSSAGRLFDAVAALCGLGDRVSYEGQVAAQLEQAADPGVLDAYPCSVSEGRIDGAELVAAAAEDLERGAPVPQVAARFHNGLAGALVRTCEKIRSDEKESGPVALSGGTWQNLLLLDRVASGLERAGFEVLVHHRVPPNDGGISLGQAVIANARSAGR